jgi:DNA polymerase-3 subunit delta'
VNTEAFKNSRAIKHLRGQIVRKTLKHSYLLITPDQNAAEDIFMLFSLLLHCGGVRAEKNGNNPYDGARFGDPEKRGKIPCMTCAECRKILTGNHSGVRSYTAKFNAEAADALIEDMYIKPIDGDYKLYFINAFDAVQPVVQNRLLKSLEEPPEYVVFFLAAKNEDGVLKTVTSRCEKLYETYCDAGAAARILKAKFPNDDFVEKAVLCAGGFVNNAENMIADAEFRRLFYECTALMNGLKKSGDIVKYIFRPLFEKEHIKTTLGILEAIINAAVRGVSEGDDGLVFIENTDVNKLNKYIFLIAEAKKKLSFNVGCVSVAESLLMSMLETGFLS